MRKLLIAAAAAALGAVPAGAATFILTFAPAASIEAVPANNDFKAELAGAGLTHFVTSGVTLALSDRARVTYEYLGSESGFLDSFESGAVSGNEDNGDHWASPVQLGIARFEAAADFFARFTTSGSPVVGTPGSDPFAIFLADAQPGSRFESPVLYFGFDDQIDNIDDNHDDFIIRATVSAIPEPATWAMMIGGLGLIGMGARRRSSRRGIVIA